MDEKRARRMKEFQDERAREIRDIEKCKNELQKEKEDAMKAKVAERARLEQIKSANLEREVMIANKKKEEAALEARLAAEYIAKVDREQAAREKALEDRMQRYKDIGEKWESSGAGKKQRETTLALEQKILREAKAKENADSERERRDKAKLRSDGKMIMETNLRMAREKKRSEKEQRDKDGIYATRFRREGEAFGAEEALRKAQDREKARKHCDLLKRQIEEQKRQQKRVDMSETEMSLNKHQMDLILKDPATGAKIMKKLNEKQTMKQSVAFKYKSNVPGLSHYDD